ncbi:hypothetical protein H696_01241 [Fonticula alba]|uniref:Enoyl-CoA hydratase n=1 Tax=Fonticula alba TaxID=691883 RepID=A0A058ZD15_FONAL|nr:hypothetical protein H696_01241 [Fonticula alba]KCV71823.1 hypothetical protein H696_01241 [Fonticula alba]|eukprot:XP_009493401.1 hypothetical protein H696_01241 [Fonticula alba]
MAGRQLAAPLLAMRPLSSTAAPAKWAQLPEPEAAGDAGLVQVFTRACASGNGDIGLIALRQPAAMNALTADMGNAFGEALASLVTPGDGRVPVRAVVLCGAPPDGDVAGMLDPAARDEAAAAASTSGRRPPPAAFSAGGDLAFLDNRLDTAPADNVAIMRRFYARFLRPLRECPVPTIAAINGHAVGAGLAISLGCDIRLAADSARMGLNFVKLGIPPGMGSTFLLQQAVGPQVAARLLLTGDLVDAATAKSYGLVLDTYPLDKVVQSAVSLAENIAGGSPYAVRATVKALRTHVDHPSTSLELALEREALTQAAAYAGGDLALGLKSIREKSKDSLVFPEWRDPTE